MRIAANRPRSAFTLVEMLVVIAIIGVLVALLVPTIGGVMVRTRTAAVAVELQDISKALEAYKSAANDYPPDFSNATALAAHMATAYPRNTRNLATWAASTDSNGRKYSDLDPAEALVFWLAMIGTNPRDPLAGASPTYTGERKVLYQFDPSRLTCPIDGHPTGVPRTDVDGDNWPEYVPKYGERAPYVYFDGRLVGGKYAYHSSAYPQANSVSATVTVVLRPYRSNTDVVPARDNNRTFPYNVPAGMNLQQWIKPGSFQLIGAGLDGDFGIDISTSSNLLFKTFPTPNLNGSTYVAGGPDDDNLASFSEMATFADSVP